METKGVLIPTSLRLLLPPSSSFPALRFVLSCQFTAFILICMSVFSKSQTQLFLPRLFITDKNLGLWVSQITRQTSANRESQLANTELSRQLAGQKGYDSHPFLPTTKLAQTVLGSA